ncbi:MAG: PAS domain-containing protein [Candidatus Obscuribacterales bacterium]|nr:PAS domain-containing protein [Candidatus Obscuribacterales bacterium]
MGLGAKLNFAFITVILAMALAQACFSIGASYVDSRNQSKKISDGALNAVTGEIKRIQERNGDVARELGRDGAFRQALASRDVAAIRQSVKALCDRRAFPGYITIVVEPQGVIFSSDTPNKGPYPPDERLRRLINETLSTGNVPEPGPERLRPGWIAPQSATGNLNLINLARVDGISAVVIAGVPIGPEIIVGMQKKIELSGDKELSKGFDLAFYSLKDNRVLAMTPGLFKARTTFLQKIGSQAYKSETEADNRMWRGQQYPNPADPGLEIARFYVATPIPDVLSKAVVLLSQIGVGAGVAIVLSFLFTAGLTSRFNASLRFLKQRAKDLAANKQDLRSLADLNGEWVELGEMMDTAVSTPRATVQTLRQQLVAKEEELMEKQRQVDSINNQLEAVNRQITTYNRQAADVNSQINAANQQAVVVQQKLWSVLQVSTEGYLMLDPFGSVMSVNPVVLNWLGTSEREISGRLCFDLVRKPGEPNDNSVQFSRPQNPNDLINFFYPEGVIYNRSSDKAVEVLIHLQPVGTDDGIIQGYIMVLRDKSVHSELARLRSEIVQMLTEAIRSPLSAGESKWEVVMSGQLQGVHPSVAQSLVELQKSWRQMLGVVDSYLMMYGGFVPAEVVQREQVSITRLIGECLEQVAVLAKQHQITLDYKTVTGLPTTAVNKEIVKDVIVQLLEKMIGVTAPGGRVRAETTVKGKEIRLIISSSGPAVHPSEIEEMFVGFIDGKHSEDTYQTRLSMYLARNNAERLGGRVWAESEAGRGTAIFLTLPVH